MAREGQRLKLNLSLTRMRHSAGSTPAPDTLTSHGSNRLSESATAAFVGAKAAPRPGSPNGRGTASAFQIQIIAPVSATPAFI